MTTAERLRECVPFHPSIGGLLILAATELDQRDDTIAQLRVERDALSREREKLREASQLAFDWATAQGRYQYHNDTISTLAHEVVPRLEAALKGETTK